MSTWQPADEIVAFLHRTVVESGADAATLTFGKATLHVTETKAQIVAFGERPMPVPIPDLAASVFKESGVRDLVVEREMLAGFVRAFVADTDPEYWPDGVADWLTTKEPK